MKKRNQKKYIIIAGLLVIIFTITLGFAYFSEVLTIESNASVNPNSSDFKVLFSSSSIIQESNKIAGVGTGSASGDSASISGTTISGISANFTEPGQKVTYTFYVHNLGAYTAYLNEISFGEAKKCSKIDSTATDVLVNSACSGISMDIKVGNTVASDSITIAGHSLDVNEVEQVVVTITYAANANRADGEFSVSFDNISLEYGTVHKGKLIKFSINGETFQADYGMSWIEWVESDYNTIGAYMLEGSICTGNHDSIDGSDYNVLIENGRNYGFSSSCPS